jgi:CBS domain containing-hemolysin-like protein
LDESRLLSIFVVGSPWLYVVLLILVLLSAFFSSAETAFSSSNVIRLRNYVEEGKRGAKKALHVTERFEKTLTTILIGNNVVNIGLTTISATILLSIFVGNPGLANIVNTVGVTFVILIFGEILPKSLAKENAESVALRYGASMYFLNFVFAPIAVLLAPIKNGVSKMYNNGEVQKPSFTDDELETLIDAMEEEGTIEEDSADMMQAVLSLKEKDVEDIMTPRVDCIMIGIDDNIQKLQALFIEHQFSRIPVFEEDKDNVIGKVHFKDLMLKMFEKEEIEIKDIMSDIHYVPETMTVDDLIENLQHNQQHIALVTGEYGGTAGIVTMEDALEELVGEIFDEHDEEFSEFLQVSDNKYIIHGDYNLDDLFDELDLPEPETGYSSVGGFLYELLENLPEIGDKVEYECQVHSEAIGEDFITHILEFTVKDVIERRIISVELNTRIKEEL